MRIDPVLSRRRPLSLTSLIDVIFLLLLFFMLSSTFTRFAEVEISAARASASAPAKTPDVLIRLEEARWSINGLRFPEDEAGAELTRLQTAGAETALLLVDEELSSQAMVSAVELVRRQTGLSLTVAR